MQSHVPRTDVPALAIGRLCVETDAYSSIHCSVQLRSHFLTEWQSIQWLGLVRIPESTLFVILVRYSVAGVVGEAAPVQDFAGTSDPIHAQDANWHQRLRLLSGELADRTERQFLAAGGLPRRRFSPD